MADSSDPGYFVLSFETLKAWCVRQKYEIGENAELGQLAVHYNLLGERAPLLIMPHGSRGMFMFAMKQPYTVPAERRMAVLEAAGLLNATSLMGAWILNRDTGELFFRVTLSTIGIGYTDAGVLQISRIVVGTSETSAPALRSIALDGADPVTTISAIGAPAA